MPCRRTTKLSDPAMSDVNCNQSAGAGFAEAHGSATYNHEWHITVRADSLHGAMDAVWRCGQAWQSGAEPLSGCCPESMGERMDYRVEKVKSPNDPAETRERKTL